MISFTDLWIPGDDERLPVSEITVPVGHHVHGRLEIRVQDRLLPALGYFGPDDVCFNEWTHELAQLVDELTRDEMASYIYDEGEQGQPAYRFDRRDDLVLVSVLEGTGGGQVDPDWQSVPSKFSDLINAVSEFVTELTSEMRAQAADTGANWVEQTLRPR